MILIIDNYDSFVHMLGQYIGELGYERQFVRNDRIDIRSILARPPDAIVLSPGPATPQKAGICIELVKACQGRIPVLGICLGHQAIAVAYAELAGEAAQHTVTRALYPAHGVSADIHHTNHPLFAGIPSPFAAARYHSLAIAHMPKTLTPLAHTQDGINMAVGDEAAQIYGLQFHPESILTPHGKQVLQNFFTLTQKQVAA